MSLDVPVEDAVTTRRAPDDLEALVEGSVDAGIFDTELDAVRRALRTCFDERENVRLAAAVHLYDAGEISLGRVARLADVTRFELPELLRERGVEVDLGPEDVEDAAREVDVARDLE